jgi:transcriptional regulator with XRE-family HTH domain
MTHSDHAKDHGAHRAPSAERLAEQIRLLMKKHGTTQAQLARALGLSASTIKRIWRSDTLTVARLEQVAAFFNLDVYDLFELARGEGATSTVLTEEQELYLATHADVAHYFWLLLNGLEPVDIAKKKGLDHRTTQRYLAALAAVGLIRRGHGRGPEGADSVARLFSWPLSFRLDGPLHRKFTEAIFATFLEHLVAKTKTTLARMRAAERAGSASEAPGFTFRLMQFLLPRESYAALREELADLLKSYVRESRRRLATTSVDRLETVTLMLGVDAFDAMAATFGEITRDGAR